MWTSIARAYPISQEWLQRQRNDCAQLTACDCIDDQNIAIFCPASVNASVALRIEHQNSSKRAHIECHSSDRAAFDRLPAWHIGDTDTVALDHCPIVAERPVRQLFERLGIRNVHTLVVTMPVASHAAAAANISDFSGYAFDGLHSIRSASIQANGQHISAATLTSLANMGDLQLSFATFDDRHLFLGNHRGLKRLRLLANHMPRLQKHLFHGTAAITHLDLSTNAIDAIDGDALELLPNLMELRLYGNQLTALPAKLVASNKALTSIALLNNRCQTDGIPAGFLQRLPALTDVTINGCKCQRLPANLFANSTNIRKVSLAYNGLQQLPDTLFGSQANLTELDLSANALATVEAALFANMNQLKVLRLSNNRLSNISR